MAPTEAAIRVNFWLSRICVRHLAMEEIGSTVPDPRQTGSGQAAVARSHPTSSSADEVLSLARNSSDPDNVPAVEGVMKTNSFSVEIAGKVYMALFPRIAVSLPHPPTKYLPQAVQLN